MKTLTEKYAQKQNMHYVELEKLRQKYIKLLSKWIENKWIIIHEINTTTPYTSSNERFNVPQFEPLRNADSDLDTKFLANYEPLRYFTIELTVIGKNLAFDSCISIFENGKPSLEPYKFDFALRLCKESELVKGYNKKFATPGTETYNRLFFDKENDQLKAIVFIIKALMKHITKKTKTKQYEIF